MTNDNKTAPVADAPARDGDNDREVCHQEEQAKLTSRPDVSKVPDREVDAGMERAAKIAEKFNPGFPGGGISDWDDVPNAHIRLVADAIAKRIRDEAAKR